MTLYFVRCQFIFICFMPIKFGYRLQYSVFKIENSDRLLSIVSSEIENRFSKQFSQSDSVYIFKLSTSCQVTKYGYSKNEDSDIIFVK